LDRARRVNLPQEVEPQAVARSPRNSPPKDTAESKSTAEMNIQAVAWSRVAAVARCGGSRASRRSRVAADAGRVGAVAMALRLRSRVAAAVAPARQM
jgi:hypothetical protein